MPFYVKKIKHKLLFLWIFLLVMQVCAELPKWVHRVNKCPPSNNLSAWMDASDKLNCLHSLTSLDPKEQKMVYHCIPSVFLNESVEFCGRNEPMQAGNCPIYNYRYAPNTSPSYYKCTHFKRGCPSKMFFSKEVYKYRECLEINTLGNCYLEEPKCREKRNRVLQSSTETYQNSTNLRISETDNYINWVLVTGVYLTLMLVLCTFLIILKHYGPNILHRSKPSIYEEVELRQLDDGEEEMSVTGLAESVTAAKTLNFKVFMNELASEMDEEYCQSIKYLVTDLHNDICKVCHPSELLHLMNRKYCLQNNLVFLQALFLRTNARCLFEKCIDYGRKAKVIFLEIQEKGQTAKDGHSYVIVCPRKDFHTEADLRSLSEVVQRILQVKESNIYIEGFDNG
ncbi:uncharacterized protein LOC125649301 isoform X2 [Ostrea edulis]|uniref:uncharacterized protein LOC125649301 isoform X2 n=1 Tax=Ostrea edulis TaxID=37623 RepID=UPI0024AFB96A|nr:uncharacterized protein LOC125649301 isoform X2 [Ostrea edulis]XP_056021835.1 uncharacterized protein LOC125649301 isoform X2 [Ostrea edulis]XP_056021836.1 uncharacterized protein LOC125649301 isoform X2 [Ostrea edulis]